MSESRPAFVELDDSASSADVPLVVDMDGTLLRSDSLYEGLACLLKQRPWALAQLPVWLLGGKAEFKKRLARESVLDVGSLPYDHWVLDLIRAARGARRIVLCTGADEQFAGAVAKELGLFDEVLSSADGVNLTGTSKAELLVKRFRKGGFDYIGNDVPDLAVFAVSRRALVVNPTPSLRRRLGDIPNVERLWDTARASSWRAHLNAMRPIQWVKNLLVFVPLLATLETASTARAWHAMLAFVAFGLIASSVYILNDLLDLSADRRHASKRYRPLASGELPIKHATIMIPILLLSGLGIGWSVSAAVFTLLLVYWFSTSLYSFWLKRVPLLDTLVLSGLYTMRILVGAAAVVVIPSVWLLSFSMFFFLSLALAKRHSELLEREVPRTLNAIPGRGYRPEDLSVLVSQGTASGYSAVLVLAFYIDSAEVKSHYQHPEIIWLICPLILYWINKLWLNSQRREVSDDPVIWALKNRVSRAIAILSLILLLLARFLPQSIGV